MRFRLLAATLIALSLLTVGSVRQTSPAGATTTTNYYYGTGSPTAVNFASPEANGGATQSLSFSTGSDGGGSYVQFTLPSLQYWDMVWVNK
ncbi:MAG TPA: glycoside hydrolase family 66 protein [Gaiellaceae bacterium]